MEGQLVVQEVPLWVFAVCVGGKEKSGECKKVDMI